MYIPIDRWIHTLYVCKSDHKNLYREQYIFYIKVIRKIYTKM